MNTLGANHKFYGKFSGNAKAWYRRAQEHVLFMNHAIVNPPVDRAKAADQVKDVFITIRKETDAGIYVSGAKVVATSSALTHYNFLGQNCGGADPRHRSRGHVHRADECAGRETVLPHLLRDDGERDGHAVRLSACPRGSTRTMPSSYSTTRFIPWEDVLLHRDLEKLKIFFPQSGFLAGYQFQGCTRLAVKLDFLVGVIAKALRATGADEFRGNQAMLGEVIAWRNLFWALDRSDGRQSYALGRRRGAPERAVGLELPRVRRRGLWPRQGNRGEDCRLCTHLSAVLGEGLQESRRSTNISRNMCAARTASATRSGSRS